MGNTGRTVVGIIILVTSTLVSLIIILYFCKAPRCKKCKHVVEEGDTYCPKCGHDISDLYKVSKEVVYKCMTCDNPISKRDKYCKACGKECNSENIEEKEYRYFRYWDISARTGFKTLAYMILFSCLVCTLAMLGIIEA